MRGHAAKQGLKNSELQELVTLGYPIFFAEDRSSRLKVVIGACAPIHPASIPAARSDCPSPGGLAFSMGMSRA
jgi:hypothetical protein